MKSVEFYTTPEGEITLRAEGEAEHTLDQHRDAGFISKFITILDEFYPEAHTALMDVYSRSALNKRYRDFLVVRRFIKCNFGLYDNMIDMDAQGNFKFEFVGCPLRGECKHDGIICNPRFNSRLSNRELEVMHLCVEGLRDDEISDRLFISLNTVNNHRKNSFKKLGVHSMPDFIRYANRNNIFQHLKKQP